MFDSSAERRPQRADRATIDEPSTRTTDHLSTDHCDACPGQHAGGTPAMWTSGLRPGQQPYRRHEYPVDDQPARVIWRGRDGWPWCRGVCVRTRQVWWRARVLRARCQLRTFSYNPVSISATSRSSTGYSSIHSTQISTKCSPHALMLMPRNINQQGADWYLFPCFPISISISISL